jgi:hypothetical protein
MEICPKAETPGRDRNPGAGQIITAFPEFWARKFEALFAPSAALINQ